MDSAENKWRLIKMELDTGSAISVMADGEFRRKLIDQKLKQTLPLYIVE